VSVAGARERVRASSDGCRFAYDGSPIATSSPAGRRSIILKRVLRRPWRRSLETARRERLGEPRGSYVGRLSAVGGLELQVWVAGGSASRLRRRSWPFDPGFKRNLAVANGSIACPRYCERRRKRRLTLIEQGMQPPLLQAVLQARESRPALRPPRSSARPVLPCTGGEVGSCRFQLNPFGFRHCRRDFGCRSGERLRWTPNAAVIPAASPKIAADGITISDCLSRRW
jgi:hypothetical protein